MSGTLATLVSAVASFGVWPAVVVTGALVFGRRYPFGSAPGLLALTGLALTITAGIAAWSVPLFLAPVAGWYRPWLIGALGWLVVLVGGAWLLGRGGLSGLRGAIARVRGSGPLRRRLPVSEWLLVAGVVGAAFLYFAFPAETIHGGRDEGVYTNRAVYLAHHGRLGVPYPWIERDAHLFAPVYRKPAGLYPTEPEMTFQFSHLLPVWLAQAFGTAREHGLFRLNAGFALLSLGVFYGLARTFVPRPYAVAATLFLAFNPSQLWLARVNLTEMLAQLFTLSGLLLLVQAIKTRSVAAASWAGVFLGLTQFVRIDSLFLVPLLFLAHLGTRVVRAPAERFDATWLALYRTALPVFALGVGAYALWSWPYLRDLRGNLVLIAAASAASLLLLVLSATRPFERIRPLLARPLLLAAGGFTMLVLGLYAYWVRPIAEPFAVYEQPGFVLFGRRTHAEDSLVNLAAYISPPAVWAALLGAFTMLFGVLRRRRSAAVIAALVPILGFTALYVWRPSVVPLFIWAIRRFVPLIIPGLVLLGAVGAWWLLRRLPRRARVAAATLGVASLTLFTAANDAVIAFFAEDRGYYDQLRAVSARIPGDRPILAHGDSVWLAPLHLAFDRQVIPLDLYSEPGLHTLTLVAERAEAEGRPAFLLYENPLPIAGFRTREVMSGPLVRPFSELSPRPIPGRTVTEQRAVALYSISGVVPERILGVNLAGRLSPRVVATGFYGPARSTHNTSRWTNGAGRIVVAGEAIEERPPSSLRVDIAEAAPSGSELSIVANGREIFQGRVGPGTWSRTFSLAGTSFRNGLTLELVSDTFLPSTGPGRPRGVRVRAVVLNGEGSG